MISVCIATYNGEKYVKEQLDSIISQLSENDEIIISDDHSTDKTVEIINLYNDSRIKFFINTKEKGYTQNFENALEKAEGDIIFLSDQDDIWLENKVQKCLEILKYNDFVVSDAIVVNNNLEVLENSNFIFRNVKHGILNNLIKCRYLGACYAFKKEVLTKSLPFPKKINFIPHDYWIYMISALFFKVQIINLPLIKYRRHNSNTSDGGEKSKNNLIKKLSIRFYLLKELLMRLGR